MEDIDFLYAARRNIERAQIVDIGGAGAQANAQLAIACALVAQTELLAAQMELSRALIERLDALTVPMVGGEKALQTFTYTQEN